MLWIKAWHIIALVAWFAGLFYLPRLFVYHTESHDNLSINRFKIMESRLFYAIIWPAGILTTVTGLWLISFNLSYYKQAGWMHVKLSLVGLLWTYHFICGYFVRQFAHDKSHYSSFFFRVFNEMPTLLLIGIVILVVVKPF